MEIAVAPPDDLQDEPTPGRRDPGRSETRLRLVTTIGFVGILSVLAAGLVLGRGTGDPPAGYAPDPDKDPSTAITEPMALNTPEQALAMHAPERNCDPWTYESSDIDGLRAAIVCSTNGGAETVEYYQFRSPEAMDAYYQKVRNRWGVRDSGQCGTRERSEGAYAIGVHQNVGRYLCIPKDAEGDAIIYWTDNRLNILTRAYRNDDDIKALYRWWQDDAGPSA